MVNRWVTAALILTVLSLLGSAIVISQVAQNSGSGAEVNATCPNGQFATSESSNGAFSCGSALTTQTALSASCSNPQFLQNISNNLAQCNTVPVPYLYVINDSCGLAPCGGASLPDSNGIITAYPTIKGLPKFSGHDCSIVLNSVNNEAVTLEANINSVGVFVKAGWYFCADTMIVNSIEITGEGEGSSYFLNTNSTFNTFITAYNLNDLSIFACAKVEAVLEKQDAPLWSNVFVRDNYPAATCPNSATDVLITSSHGLYVNTLLDGGKIGMELNNTVPIMQKNMISNTECVVSHAITNCLRLDGSNVQFNVINSCASCGSVIDDTGRTNNFACPPLNVNSDLFCTSWANIGLYPANCPANQFVIGVTTTLSCSAQSAVTTEKAAGCPGAQQFMTTESANGDVSCGIVTYGTCPANQFATAITTTTLNCGAQLAVTTEAAAGCPANQFVTTESANGAVSCGAVSTEGIASCSTGQYATSENAAGVFNCGNPTIQFVQNSSTCTDTTSGSAVMAGMQVNYTPNGTGKVSVTLNFKIATPATVSLNSQWQLAFGTGKEPVCNAAATGTLVGQKYEQGTWAAIASFVSPSVTAGVFTLTPGTRYWFDLQITDSSAAAWTYSLPQLTIVES